MSRFRQGVLIGLVVSVLTVLAIDLTPWGQRVYSAVRWNRHEEDAPGETDAVEKVGMVRTSREPI